MQARHTGLPQKSIKDYPLALLFHKILNSGIRDEADSCRHFMKLDEDLGKRVVHDLQNDPCSHIYAFNTASYTLLNAERSAKGILEQCSLPYSTYRDAVILESQKFSEWTRYSVDEKKEVADIGEFIRREEAEWALADRIVCPSVHVKKDLVRKGVPEEKISLIPYGFNYRKVVSPRRISPGAGLRIGTVGYISIRKGIHHFYHTALNFPGAEYIAVGPRGFDLTDRAMSMLSARMRLKGQLSARAMEEEYGNMDVLLFLTIGEGSATVVYEALSLGIPVVTTASCGSIVEDGVSGFIVEPDDQDRIAHCLELLSEPEFYRDMSARALLRSEYGSSQAYAHRLISFFQDLGESGFGENQKIHSE